MLVFLDELPACIKNLRNKNHQALWKAAIQPILQAKTDEDCERARAAAPELFRFKSSSPNYITMECMQSTHYIYDQQSFSKHLPFSKSMKVSVTSERVLFHTDEVGDLFCFSVGFEDILAYLPEVCDDEGLDDDSDGEFDECTGSEATPLRSFQSQSNISMFIDAGMGLKLVDGSILSIFKLKDSCSLSPEELAYEHNLPRLKIHIKLEGGDEPLYETLMDASMFSGYSPSQATQILDFSGCCGCGACGGIAILPPFAKKCLFRSESISQFHSDELYNLRNSCKCGVCDYVPGEPKTVCTCKDVFPCEQLLEGHEPEAWMGMPCCRDLPKGCRAPQASNGING